MRYDLHIHTNISKCAALRPEDILKIAKKKKLDGIAVTDHDTMKGALAVSKLNKDKDFDVVIGSEIKTNWGDLLVYNQTAEIKEREFFSVLDRVREQGAIASIAHPYRVVPWNTFKGDFRKITGYRGQLPCLEVFNSRSVLFENILASRAAKRHGLAGTGGSDAHFKFDIGNGYTIFEGDLAKAVKMRKLRTGGTMKYGLLSGMMSFLKKRVF